MVMHADLHFGRQIGKGACSVVKIARHKKTGENYAVKLFNIYDEVRTISCHKDPSQDVSKKRILIFGLYNRISLGSCKSKFACSQT